MYIVDFFFFIYLHFFPIYLFIYFSCLFHKFVFYFVFFPLDSFLMY